MNKALLTALWIGSTISLGLVAIWALWMIPEFVVLFADFEHELPQITNLLVLSHLYWWIFPFISLLCGIAIMFRQQLGSQSIALLGGLFIGGIILAFVLFLGSIFAIYAPLFSGAHDEKRTSYNQRMDLTRYDAFSVALNV